MGNFRCGICENKFSRTVGDFTICPECNTGLAAFADSPYILLSAIKYTLRHHANWEFTTHPTQIQSPIQCQGFVEILVDMWQTHLDKNADYSPANILLTGETGLVTRLWDKIARLLSLTGFKFKAILHEGVDVPKNPKNESIEDTYRDLTVYGVIGLLLRRGKWGK